MPRLPILAAVASALLSPYPIVAYTLGTRESVEVGFPILKAAGVLHAVVFVAYLVVLFRRRSGELDRTFFLSGLAIWLASMAIVAIRILSR